MSTMFKYPSHDLSNYLSVVETEINPFSGEWFVVDGREEGTCYIHTSSREKTNSFPSMLKDENRLISLSSIGVGLGGDDTVKVEGIINDNYVVFEHPLFPAAPGWRITKT
jgi:hypothetical protein